VIGFVFLGMSAVFAVACFTTHGGTTSLILMAVFGAAGILIISIDRKLRTLRELLEGLRLEMLVDKAMRGSKEKKADEENDGGSGA
jgi:hypothetical protein